MNNLQPYEKHLADKLQQVPVPDKDEGWKEMRKLLDRDMPEGGAGWGGNGKWWWMGITVAIIICGLWLSQQFNESDKTRANQELASSDGPATKENSAELLTQDNNQDSKKNNIEVDSKKEQQSLIATNDPVVKDDKNLAAKNSTASIYGSGKSEKESQEKILVNKRTTAVSLVPKKEPSAQPGNGNKYASFTQQKSNNRLGRNASILDVFNKRRGNTSSGGVIPGTESMSTVDQLVPSSSQYGYLPKRPEEKTKISSSIKPNELDEFFQNPVELYSVLPSTQDPLRAEPGKTDKAFAKEMRLKSIKDDNRKISRKGMRGIGGEKDHELTFAAGLSLPQSFAIGSQQSPSYGVNAKPGTISDYLPVPFFQYHINNRLFVQTELQFQTPQFTDKLLIYQSQLPVAPTNGMLEKNIFIEKLYYFHIPFNVYFSPVRNFYFGSGLQYSSLLSGVATYQDNRYSNGTLQNSYSRVQSFKDDSIAAKLASSEWRYQLEGNYYFSRFTVGARYNQALSQFVNLQPSAALPFTQGRNKSFLVYLRYNIWEERKKNVYSIAGNW